jgi:hypothetical protein
MNSYLLIIQDVYRYIPDPEMLKKSCGPIAIAIPYAAKASLPNNH